MTYASGTPDPNAPENQSVNLKTPSTLELASFKYPVLSNVVFAALGFGIGVVFGTYL